MRLTLLFLLFVISCRAQSDTTIRFYFDFASWELKGKDPFARLDETRWEPFLTVEARTDTTGSTVYNRDLADFRLNAVKKLLEKYPYFMISDSELTGEDYTVKRTYRPENERCVIVTLKPKVPGTLYSRSRVSAGYMPEPMQVVTDTPIEETTRMPRTFHPDSAVAEGDVLILRNIEFLINETIVTLESYPEMQQLVKVMKEHPKLHIHIRGHVCCAPAQSLSEQRAKKIFTYLVSNGIEEHRMTWKGYSNKLPNPEKKDDLFDQAHRRVEIVVVKE